MWKNRNQIFLEKARNYNLVYFGGREESVLKSHGRDEDGKCVVCKTVKIGDKCCWCWEVKK